MFDFDSNFNLIFGGGARFTVNYGTPCGKVKKERVFKCHKVLERWLDSNMSDTGVLVFHSLKDNIRGLSIEGTAGAKEYLRGV